MGSLTKSRIGTACGCSLTWLLQIVNPKGEMKGSAITGPVGKEAAELWPVSHNPNTPHPAQKSDTLIAYCQQLRCRYVRCCGQGKSKGVVLSRCDNIERESPFFLRVWDGVEFGKLVAGLAGSAFRLRRVRMIHTRHHIKDKTKSLPKLPCYLP